MPKNRGLQSVDEQKQNNLNLAQIFPNAPIVAYMKDKSLRPFFQS